MNRDLSDTSKEPKCPQILLPYRELKWMTTQMTKCFVGGRSLVQGESPVVPTQTDSPTDSTDTKNVSPNSQYSTSKVNWSVFQQNYFVNINRTFNKNNYIWLSFFLLELKST